MQTTDEDITASLWARADCGGGIRGKSAAFATSNTALDGSFSSLLCLEVGGVAQW